MPEEEKIKNERITGRIRLEHFKNSAMNKFHLLFHNPINEFLIKK